MSRSMLLAVMEKPIQAVTKSLPFKPHYRRTDAIQKGDLIEYVTVPNSSAAMDDMDSVGARKGKLAIVQRTSESDYTGGRTVIVGVSREDGQRWIPLSQILFHYPAFKSIRKESDISTLCRHLGEFHEMCKLESLNIVESVQRFAESKAASKYLDRLLYYEELVEAVYPGVSVDSVDAVSAYSLYKAMQRCRLLRDGQSKTFLTYRPTPKYIERALDSVADITTIHTALHHFIFRSRPLPGTDAIRAALELIQFTAAVPDNQKIDSRVSTFVRQVLDGVWPYHRQSDLLLFLNQIGDYPGNRGFPIRQSVVSEYDHEPIAIKDITVSSTPVTLVIVQPGEIFAIDSAETVEVDDAVCVSFDSDNTPWLHVHIADPADLFGIGSEVDDIARSRVGTVYLPEVTHPMLPTEVTAQCSLDAVGAKKSISFSIKLSASGDILNYHVSETSVFNVKRLTYEAVDLILKDPQHPNHHCLIAILNMAKGHREFRERRGMLSVHLPTPKIHINSPNNVSVTVEDTEESPSHLLVSESMVMAGRVAAMLAIDCRRAMPFRRHEYVGTVTSTVNMTLQDKLRLLEGMKPADVQAAPKVHAAMGLDCYVKATSPLRRYGDLLAHYQLKHIISKRTPSVKLKQLCSLLPRLRKNELYLRRLQQSTIRFWLLSHIHQLLRKSDTMSVETPAIAMHEPTLFYFPQWAVSLHVRMAGDCVLEPYSVVTLKITVVDALRQLVTAQVVV